MSHSYSLTHLSDDALAHAFHSAVHHEGEQLANLLAHLGEFRTRRLYAPAGYSSMHAYCVGHLHYSDDAAFRRIRAAKLAMRFPMIFRLLAERRLHLTALVVLSGKLVESNAEELLAAAAHKTREEIEELLAQRYPRPDVPTTIRPLTTQVVASPVASDPKLALAPVESRVQFTPPAAAPDPRPRVTPLAPERYALQLTVSHATREKLRRAQELLGFTAPTGDLAAVLDRALDALLEKLERQKCAKADRPRASRSVTDARHVPAHVRRAVWKRDRGRCTFESDQGLRCGERSALELDHIVPVARGGESTVGNLRLRCRAHNQLEAERVFGAGFMEARREHAHA